MAGVPSPWWGRGASLTLAFLSSPGSSEGNGVRVCPVQPGAHQVTETNQLLGPALPDTQDSGCPALARWEPGLFGSQSGVTLPEDACARCSSCQHQAGTEQPSLPCSICHISWVPVADC